MSPAEATVSPTSCGPGFHPEPPPQVTVPPNAATAGSSVHAGEPCGPAAPPRKTAAYASAYEPVPTATSPRPSPFTSPSAATDQPHSAPGGPVTVQVGTVAPP